FVFCFFFFSSRRRHTRFSRDWSSDVCSSDLLYGLLFRNLHYLQLHLISYGVLLKFWLNNFLLVTRIQDCYPTIHPLRCCFDFDRSEERRVGKSVDVDGCRRSKKKK